jgi:AraC-like DNA-binding protein
MAAAKPHQARPAGVAPQWKTLKKKVTRLAAVRPPGLAGASTEGFFRVVHAPYPVEIFEERRDALRAVGAGERVAFVDEIVATAQETDRTAFVAELRRVIDDDLVESTVATVAKRLGVSVRSLQRRLRDSGTCFQRELSLVRVDASRRLMRETDAPISRIATDVGFASPAVLSIVFRRHEGLSPSAWRQKQRK